MVVFCRTPKEIMLRSVGLWFFRDAVCRMRANEFTADRQIVR